MRLLHPLVFLYGNDLVHQGIFLLVKQSLFGEPGIFDVILFRDKTEYCILKCRFAGSRP